MLSLNRICSVFPDHLVFISVTVIMLKTDMYNCVTHMVWQIYHFSFLESVKSLLSKYDTSCFCSLGSHLHCTGEILDISFPVMFSNWVKLLIHRIG